MDDTSLIYLRAIVYFVAIIIVVSIIYGKIKKKIYVQKDSDIVEHNNMGRLISFNFENKTNEKLVLDITQLEQNDKYNFSCSLADYKKFIEYIKIYTINIISTKVNYSNTEICLIDIVKLKTYTPFEYLYVPILVGIHDYENKNQTHTAQSLSKYKLDYFNSVIIELRPNEKKSIEFLVVDMDIDKEIECVKCAMKIKNLTDKTENVNLFDKYYMKENFETKKVKIDSVFEINDYNSVMGYYNSNLLFAEEIKVFAPYSEQIKYQINFDKYEMKNSENKTLNTNKNYYEIDLKDRKYIKNFSIELQPNQEVIVSFK